MKRLFIITGANGFLGYNVIKLLNENPDNEIRALLLPNEKNNLKDLNCDIYYGDVTNIETLQNIFLVNEKCDVYVIHLAAIVSIKTNYDPQIHNVNVNGTVNIAQMTKAINGKMIYINSVHSIPEVKGKKEITEIEEFHENKVRGAYAKSKAIAANAILEMTKKGLNACIIQPSGIIGPNDYGHSHLTQLIIDTISGKLKACVRGGYDFIDVRDVSQGIISACTNGRSGECYILSNQFYSINDIIDLISKYAKTKKVKTILPMWLARLTAPLAELYYKVRKRPPLYTSYSLYTLRSNSYFSNSKAKKELAFSTRPIEETIKDSVEFIKKRDNI